MTTPSFIDTITAQATPPGRGGVAIVRVSGPKVKQLMQAVLGREIPPRQASYLPFLDEAGDVIDEGIAVYFSAPNSFTGEDVLELQGHGGPVVVDLILQRLLSAGARLARPGEFSERAYHNDKLDLAQAEAIADLINASSRQAARSALRSLQGAFSSAIHAISEKLVYLRMYVEAAIDFTDEEIDFLSDKTLSDKMEEVRRDLHDTQQKARQGSFLREGITAVIVGEPNVGKSSLLNCLSGREAAIVTPIPGTTRDVLRESILIDGMPLYIVDTAGLRESDDIVEQEGIRRAYREIENADVVLYVVDASRPDLLLQEQLPSLAANVPVIVIQNKIDLTSQSPARTEQAGRTLISLSARSGDGIELLTEAIKSLVGFHGEDEGLFLARRRHLDALARAQQRVDASHMQLSQYQSGELAAEELRLAHLALSEITGEFTADDLLSRIFSSFCVGK